MVWWLWFALELKGNWRLLDKASLILRRAWKLLRADKKCLGLHTKYPSSQGWFRGSCYFMLSSQCLIELIQLVNMQMDYWKDLQEA